jgi:type II secretory pathway pseudopilin PulG
MHKLKGNEGFILADVTLGIFIISIALLAITILFTQALQTEKVASDYTLAANLIQKQLELLKCKAPAYWAGLEFPCTIPWQDGLLPPPKAYELTTQAAISAQDSHLIEVTVTAAWKEKAKDYSIQFVSFYSTIPQ